jgi:hypothetical protein
MDDSAASGPTSKAVRLRRLAAAVLAVGFAASIAIYLTARPEAENPLGYDPMQTKTYLHDLELYGGKANVLAAEFREWFTGLWQGRNLAFTLAVITVLVALAIRFVAALPPPEALDDTESPTNPPRPGA